LKFEPIWVKKYQVFLIHLIADEYETIA
jgi:hypothetical protein